MSPTTTTRDSLVLTNRWYTVAGVIDCVLPRSGPRSVMINAPSSALGVLSETSNAVGGEGATLSEQAASTEEKHSATTNLFVTTRVSRSGVRGSQACKSRAEQE